MLPITTSGLDEPHAGRDCTGIGGQRRDVGIEDREQNGEGARVLEEILTYKARPHMRAMQAEEEGVLRMRVIRLDEVRRDLQKWVPPFQKEKDMLLNGPSTMRNIRSFAANSIWRSCR